MKQILILLLLSVSSLTYAQVTVYSNPLGKTVVKSSLFGNDFVLEYKGDITVTDDDKDIKSISRGGYIEISKSSFGSRRTLFVEEQNGKLYREFKEGSKVLPWDPEGKEWLATILPDILRMTTISAEPRVAGFYAKGGAAAVIKETQLIESDFIKKEYLSILIKNHPVTTSELVSIANYAGENINSDFYLTELYSENMEKFLQEESTCEAMLKGSSAISSDYYAAEILESALKKYKFSDNMFGRLLTTASTISSDYYLANVLSTALTSQELTPSHMTAIARTSREIDSDYYQSEVLVKASRQGRLDEKALISTIEASRSISSDNYLNEVLISIARNNPANDKVSSAICEVTRDEVGSDYYASDVLIALIPKKLSGQSLTSWLDAIDHVESDSYASDAMKKLATEGQLDKKGLLLLIKHIEGLSSDHYASEVLISIASVMDKNDKELTDAYHNAAENISSSSYYADTIKALRK